MRATTTIVLARHGRTAWGDARYAGTSDVELDETGRLEAEALAAWAGRQGFSALVSSPLGRARQTAAPLAARLALEARVESDLRELDFGIAEGRTLEELERDHPAIVRAFLSDPALNAWPAGEDPQAAAWRGAECLRRLAREEPGGRVLAVTHRTLIRLIVCHFLGVGLARYRTLLPRLDPAAVTTLQLTDDDGAALINYNAGVTE